ncbi:helix-turn-helix domain-containing protein [Desulfoferrobacter suflitae]|uniref:helix-turn-helix domain-containing protein n=1 Tax=Desulfoferrobacter suflitae TaxID=2865782 RepID=UPI0033900AF4
MENEYLTLKQLSQYSSLHINTLKLWMKKGMPFYRIGRSVRIKRSEFDLWMRNNFQAGGTGKQRFDHLCEQALKEVLG